MYYTSFKTYFTKRNIVISLLYLTASFIILNKNGIQLGGEAEKYIYNANRIINFEELSHGVFGLFYYVYSFCVAFFIKFNLPIILVSVLQIFVSLIAALLLQSCIKTMLNCKRTATFVFIAYLLCYPIQKWNYFLYSEGLHISFITIGFCLLNLLVKHYSLKLLVISIIICLAIVFSRPTGLLFILAFLIASILYFRNKINRKAFYTLNIACIATILLLMFSPLSKYVNPDSLIRQEIICQVPTVHTTTNYKEYNINGGILPALKVIREEVGVGNFIVLGIKKIVNFFGMFRSYYSIKNNFLLIANWMFYILAVVGLFYKTTLQIKFQKLMGIIFILITSIGIFFTCDDWANRFVAPLFPVILVLASFGFYSLYSLQKKQC